MSTENVLLELRRRAPISLRWRARRSAALRYWHRQNSVLFLRMGSPSPAAGTGLATDRPRGVRGGVIKEVVGVEDGVVVADSDEIAMERVAARFADEVDLSARHAAVLRAVGVQDHGGFGDIGSRRGYCCSRRTYC